MNSYADRNAYNRTVSLEGKVRRLEEMHSHSNNGQRYSFKKTPSHYRSAVHLSNVAQDLKQDLSKHPYTNNLDRRKYLQMYDRVSFIEKELNDIIREMNSDSSQKLKYQYRNSFSPAYSNRYYYDEVKTPKRCNTCPKKYVIHSDYGDSLRKRTSHHRFFEKVSSETSSSDSVEEIIYYIESSTSSSSSSVIVEEYVPKTTRRTVRKVPIDVSKSKPRIKPVIIKEVHKPKPKRERKPPPEISVKKQRKVVKHKKEKKLKPHKKSYSINVGVNKSKSDDRVLKKHSETRKRSSEIFLVKRSIESPTNNQSQRESIQKKEIFFVSRLKKMELSDDKGSDHEKVNSSSNLKENNSDSYKKYSELKNGMSKDVSVKGKQTSDKNHFLKSKSRRNKRVSGGGEKSQHHRRSSASVVVLRSSFVLNDPFVRTVNYDDYYSSPEEENYSSHTFNSDRVDNYRVKKNSAIMNSESEKTKRSQKTHNASKYKVIDSYSVDPFLKSKNRVNRFEKQNKNILTTPVPSSVKVYNEREEETVHLNDNELKSYQNSLTLNQSRRSSRINRIISENQTKNKSKIGDENSLRYNKSNTVKSFNNEPVAHSVYLTTLPVYQTNSNNLQPSFNRPKRDKFEDINNETHSLRKNITSYHSAELEDAILLNVAKKISPVVAKIINGGLNPPDKGENQSQNKFLSSKQISMNEKFSVYPINTNENESYIFNNSGINNAFSPLSLVMSKDSEIKYSSGEANKEILVEGNPVSGNVRKSFLKSQIYEGNLENNSQIKRKSSMKKRQSISEVEETRESSSGFKSSFGIGNHRKSTQESNLKEKLLDRNQTEERRSVSSKLQNGHPINQEQNEISGSSNLKSDSSTRSLFSWLSRDRLPVNNDNKQQEQSGIFERSSIRQSNTKPIMKDIKMSRSSLQNLLAAQILEQNNSPHANFNVNKANLIKVRSISGYYESKPEPSTAMSDDEKINLEPTGNPSLLHLEISKGNNNVEDDISRKSENEDEEIIFIGQSRICPQKTPLPTPPPTPPPSPQNSVAKSIPVLATCPEVQNQAKNPLQYSIHLRKEKRSKFECKCTSSTLSLDVLSSRCTKVYSTEELSFSEHIDGKEVLHRSYKTRPNKYIKNRNFCRKRCLICPNERQAYSYSNAKKCTNVPVTKSEQLISDSSYSVNWLKVANEIKYLN